MAKGSQVTTSAGTGTRQDPLKQPSPVSVAKVFLLEELEEQQDPSPTWE
jgi:hypothetical protein